MLKRLAAVLRSGEWWDYKLVPILTGFYATALFLRMPVSAGWQAALLLLASLVPGAAFVSLLNDVTDIAADAAACKANRMAARSPAFSAAAIAAALAGGLPFFWIWRHDPLLLCWYAAAWIAFACYSAPPVRLKARGLPGLLADAAGAHLFPTLLAASAAFAAAGRAPDPLWLAAIAAWSLACGCRGNLWHQLLDREADRRAGVATYAVRRSPEALARFARAVFAVEVAALLLLVALMRHPLPIAACILYLLLPWRRARLWGLKTVVAQPRRAYRLWLDDLYAALLPLAILAASAIAAPRDLLVLAVHLLLFGRRPVETAQESWTLIVLPVFNRLAGRRRAGGRG